MIWFMMFGCTEFQSFVMSVWPIDYTAPTVEAGVQGQDTRVTVTPVLSDFPQITDVAFIQNAPGTLLLTQKEGALVWANLATEESKTVHTFDVRTSSEQGLLSVALHPNFNQNGLIYLHRSPNDGSPRTEIAEYKYDVKQQSIERTRILFEVEQPYPNHNGGAVRFGVDGHLYVGLGDGGWRNDPKANGQNFTSPLGGILRLSVDTENIVPSDNPFVGVQTNPSVKGDAKHDLLWATGLRNPWKFSLLPDGRAIIADVGQNAFEEVSIAGKGDNLGWNVWEGNDCLEKNCQREDVNGDAFVFPVHTYPHSEGQSITGGVLLSGEHRYNGQYIFGDFVTGKVWTLSEWDAEPTVELLTQLRFNISTFAQDAEGSTYVADFGPGILYRLEFPR